VILSYFYAFLQEINDYIGYNYYNLVWFIFLFKLFFNLKDKFNSRDNRNAKIHNKIKQLNDHFHHNHKPLSSNNNYVRKLKE